MKVAMAMPMLEIPEKPKSSLKTAPVFVVGPLRSGTSLLYALLNQHPEIALMYECDVWNFPRMFSNLRFRGDWKARLEFFSQPFSRHRLIYGDSFRGLEHVRTPHDLYKTFAEVRDARVFGEKSPFYCTRLAHLAQNHPGAAFILIWREPLEVHRSILDAASGSYFFRRPGMLSRFIYAQEQMIREGEQLKQTGARVYHVTYDDLIDRTEVCCRGICDFLEIEFDGKMLSLAGADLSAVFRAPQHEYLRRGKIERREFSAHEDGPRIHRKLERYRTRWNRLNGRKFRHRTDVSDPEPSLPERMRDRLAGLIWYGFDGVKRLGFEFLPLPWLRTYRQIKSWFRNGQTERTTLAEELGGHKATILLSLAILTGVAIADHLTGPAVSLMAFYVIPPAILALIINKRWGTAGAVISTVVWAFVQNADNPFINRAHLGIMLWDGVMRFLVMQIIVLLLERIRVEIKSEKFSGD